MVGEEFEGRLKMPVYRYLGHNNTVYHFDYCLYAVTYSGYFQMYHALSLKICS